MIRSRDHQPDTGSSLIQIRLTVQVLKMQAVADKKARNDNKQGRSMGMKLPTAS